MPAAVELPPGVAVFAGPSGVGKSTIVTGLATTPSGTRCCPTPSWSTAAPRYAPSPSRCCSTTRSRAWLGAEAQLLQHVPHRYCLGREGYHLPSSHLSVGGRARLLLFPHRATSHYVRELTADHARGRLRAGDLIVNDLRRYWAFAAVLELLDPHPLVVGARSQFGGTRVGGAGVRDRSDRRILPRSDRGARPGIDASLTLECGGKPPHSKLRSRTGWSASLRDGALGPAGR